MKTTFPTLLAILLAVSTAVLAARNRALAAELNKAQATLAAHEKEPQKPARRPSAPKAPRRVVVPRDGESASLDGAAFDQAVEERAAALVEEERQRREAERAERRRAWENETDEQREARRREFQERVREHASARLGEFVEKAGLDDQQCTALENELGLLDSRVREIVSSFAADIGNGAKFDFEAQMQLLNNMSAAVLETYAGLDETLPAGWRDRDDGFNVMLGIGPDAFNPLFETLRRSGMRGFGSLAPFMGGGGGPRRCPPPAQP